MLRAAGSSGSAQPQPKGSSRLSSDSTTAGLDSVSVCFDVVGWHKRHLGCITGPSVQGQRRDHIQPRSGVLQHACQLLLLCIRSADTVGASFVEPWLVTACAVARLDKSDGERRVLMPGWRWLGARGYVGLGCIAPAIWRFRWGMRKTRQGVALNGNTRHSGKGPLHADDAFLPWATEVFWVCRR